MPSDPQEDQPGLSSQQYEQMVQFLMTWAGLSREQAEERAAGRLYPGQVTRTHSAAVSRPIYPPGCHPAPRQPRK